MVDYLETGIIPENPSAEQKINQCLTHAKKLMEIEPERTAISEMRGHAPWYMKGLKSSSYVKDRLSKVSSYQELEEILNLYLEYLNTGDKSVFEKFNR